MFNRPTIQKFSLFCIILFMAFLINCEKMFSGLNFGSKNDKPFSGAKGTISVCIESSMPVHSTQGNTAPIISNLDLGENVLVTENRQPDETDPKTMYVEIVLSDGTRGWCRERGVVLDAYPGVFKKTSRIYKRPDSLTVSDIFFNCMDIVAIKQQSGEWYQVIGENRENAGWVKSNHVFDSEAEVGSAVYIRSKLVNVTCENRVSTLENVLKTTPFKQSYFADLLQQLLSIETLLDSKADLSFPSETGMESSPLEQPNDSYNSSETNLDDSQMGEGE